MTQPQLQNCPTTENREDTERQTYLRIVLYQGTTLVVPNGRTKKVGL